MRIALESFVAWRLGWTAPQGTDVAGNTEHVGARVDHRSQENSKEEPVTDLTLALTASLDGGQAGKRYDPTAASSSSNWCNSFASNASNRL